MTSLGLDFAPKATRRSFSSCGWSGWVWDQSSSAHSLSHLCFKPPPSSSALCFSFTFFILPPILLPLFHLTKLQSEALFNGSPPSLSLSPSSLSPSFSSLSPQVTDHMATAADLHETITRFCIKIYETLISPCGCSGRVRDYVGIGKWAYGSEIEFSFDGEFSCAYLSGCGLAVDGRYMWAGHRGSSARVESHSGRSVCCPQSRCLEGFSVEYNYSQIVELTVFCQHHTIGTYTTKLKGNVAVYKG